MKDSSSPFVSIITVNFNGIFFLKTLFDSIASLNYPKEKIQVIMVDNGSTDGSVSYVKSSYFFVEILEVNKNLGFAGGNNEGLKAARGDYIAFINNDCVVDRDWLGSLVCAMEEKEAQNIKIGGAGSKVLFYFKYLSLRLSFDRFPDGSFTNEGADDFKALIKGLKINSGSNEFLQADADERIAYKKNILEFANKSFKYPSGFYDWGRDADKNIIKRVKNNALVRVPVADANSDMEVEFKVSFLEIPANFKIFLERSNSSEPAKTCLFDFKENNIAQDIINTGDGSSSIATSRTEDPGKGKNIKAGKYLLGKNTAYIKSIITPQDESNFIKITLKIPSEKYGYCQNIVNSCGSMINNSFYAKEINYECADHDSPQQPFEVFALPGSSFIINKKLVEEIGLFDEQFFTYYEDIDLFWRSALKGWMFFAVPGSVARHFHCGSGEEWSYSFTYYVLRNRLLMIYRCCWFSGFLKNYLSFGASAFTNLLYLAAAKARKRELNRPDILIRVKIFFEFFILMARHIVKRFKIRANSSGADKIIKKWQQDF